MTILPIIVVRYATFGELGGIMLRPADTLGANRYRYD